MPFNILDAVTRHQIFVQRYAAGRENDAVVAVNNIKDQILGRIAGDITEWQQARLSALYLDLADLTNSLVSNYSTALTTEMLDFAQYETDFNISLLGKSADAELIVPANEQVAAVVYSKPMQVEVQKGYTIARALQMFGNRKSQQIVQIIKDSILIGDTLQKIVGNLKSNFDLQKQQARTIARTVTNHVSTQARQATLSANADILDGYEWVSVLDSRTSLICASRDGQVYPIGDDPILNPKPPAHFSCRSTIVPAVKSEYSLISSLVGKRSAVGAKGPGQVRGDLTYEQWLGKQPKSFQDVVLGKARGELFRTGKLSLGRFIDDAGNTLTLDELRRLEPLAFEEAGI